jgi:hypothetical protein
MEEAEHKSTCKMGLSCILHMYLSTMPAKQTPKI